jgi:CheY-like chemotaxis protein
MSNDEKINILLVDDRPENLLALEAIIERDDYNLIKASSGEEALKYILKYDFAAILLDVQMPGIDGFGTAKIIKAREKTKHIPIVFITANNMDSDHIFTGYSIGAIDYILKPFDPFILKAKVEGFVEMYKLNRKLIQQAEILAEKTRELEKAYNELSKTSSDLRVSEALAKDLMENRSDLTGKRVLLVDDDVRNVFALSSVLEMYGMKVTFAENGIEALEVLDKSSDFDLVLTDIMMPEMDGYETIHRLRAIPQFAKLPVIALTAKAMKEDREKCINAGASDYIVKPVNTDQLISLIRVWLHTDEGKKE